MRDILFRAKRKDNGEWIEGYVVFERYPQYPFVRPSILEVDKDGAIKVGSFEEDYSYQFVKVDQDTICQYTGLTDKNKNKIWENDIVCTPYINPIFGDMVNNEVLDDFEWKVVFYEGLFCVENETHRIYLRDFTNGNNIKVIKNYFDD